MCHMPPNAQVNFNQSISFLPRWPLKKLSGYYDLSKILMIFDQISIFKAHLVKILINFDQIFYRVSRLASRVIP